MPTFALNSPPWNISLTTTAGCSLWTPEVLTLLWHLHALDREVSVSSLTLEAELTLAGTPTGMYEYKLELHDGREWVQRLQVGVGNPRGNYEVPGMWTDAEVVLQRPVRIAVITLISAKGLTELSIVHA